MAGKDMVNEAGTKKMGFISINGEDYDCEYDDGHLYVYSEDDPKIAEFFDIKNKEEDPCIKVHGNPGEEISFFYHDYGYGLEEKTPYIHDEENETFTFRFLINEFIAYEKESKKENHLSFLSERLRPLFPSEKDCASMESSFFLNDKKIVVESGKEGLPGVILHFPDLEEKELIELYRSMRNLLQFLFKSKDVPVNASFSNAGKEGHIYRTREQKGEDSHACIPWEGVYEKLLTLMPVIKELDKRIIPVDEESRYSLSTTVFTGIVFTKEFEKTYPDYVPTTPFARPIVSYEEEEFVKRVEFALNDNEEALRSIREKFDINLLSGDIANECSDFLTNEDWIESSRDTYLSFIMVNCLIYIFYLRRGGFSKEEIDSLLPYLYNE